MRSQLTFEMLALMVGAVVLAALIVFILPGISASSEMNKSTAAAFTKLKLSRVLEGNKSYLLAVAETGRQIRISGFKINSSMSGEQVVYTVSYLATHENKSTPALSPGEYEYLEFGYDWVNITHLNHDSQNVTFRFFSNLV